MIDMIAIPGADELVGKGVYRGLPDDIPQPVRDRNAVVVGEAVECATAARQLGKAGWSVTARGADSLTAGAAPARALPHV
jgi:hypothetical protein